MKDASPLIQCVYASTAKVEFNKELLNGLLENCRRNNAGKNVTGMLLYHNRAFFQVLEGAAEDVLPLFDKISLDPRHSRVSKILQLEIENRSFGDWTMGYSDVTYADLANIDGLNDFFMGDRPFSELESERTQKLLDAFKDGRWRQTIG
jgi:hypothetical protein